MIVPYFGVGFLWMLPIRMGVGYSRYDKKGISDILIKFLTVNDVGHLWFLPTLFFIIIITYYLNKVDNNYKYIMFIYYNN